MKEKKILKKELIEELRGLRQRCAQQARELQELRKTARPSEPGFAILENLPAFAYIQAPDYSIRYANDYFKKQYGEPGKKLCYELMWGRKEPCLECPTFRVFKTGNSEVWESVHSDGRSFMVYDYLIEDADGSPLVLEMSIDTTEMRRAEREQKRVQSELFQLHKMEAIGNLAGGLAHDIKNKMTVVKALAGQGHKKSSGQEPADTYFGLILSAAEGVMDLTQRLTSFSRKGADSKLLMDLNDVVSETVKFLTPVIGSNINIDMELEPELELIMTDKINMEQVLVNLIINARDAMPSGGSIIIRTGKAESDGGEFICLSVADTGVGMDSRTREMVFTPFFTTKGCGVGAGLGLSIAREVVRAHNGHIEVESDPGEGSCFKVYLPLTDVCQSPGQADEGVAFDEADSYDSLRGSGERILILMSTEATGKATAMVLGRNNYSVSVVRTAAEALSILERKDSGIAAIICDTALPRTGGVEFVEALVEAFPELAVVLTSTEADISSKVAGSYGRAFFYLERPYGISKLLGALKQVLDLSVGSEGLRFKTALGD